MRDDRSMDAFDVIVAELFGDAVDSREAWDIVSKANDASEVHAPGNIKTKAQMKREKRQAQVGLASNVVGITAGTAALMAAGKDERLDHAGRLGAAIQKPYKLVSRTKPGAKWAEIAARPKVAGGLALGAVGLQGTNMAGDLVANRVLNREAKKEVKKALGDIVAARRAGKISTEDAIKMSAALVEGVSKIHAPDAKDIHDAAEAIVPVVPSKKLQMANQGYQAGKKMAAKGKKLVPRQPEEPVIKSAKSEAARIARVGLKAIGDESKAVLREGAKAAGTEAKATVQTAGQEARSTVRSVGEESRKLPKSVDDTIGEARGLVSDVRAGVNDGRKAVTDAGRAVREGVEGAEQKIRTGVKAIGDDVERRAKKVVLIGAGGLAAAGATPVVAHELGANHRAKKYGVPIGHAPVKKNGPDVTWTAEIAKMDSSKRQVFGFAMVTHIDGEPVVDLQGDYTPLEEIEKAAYTYVLDSRKGGDMHRRDGEQPLHTADLVESFVITPEKLTQMGLEENALPHGWWVGFKVNDDKQWADVVAKRRTGFSIHGSGKRVEKEIVTKSVGKEEAIAGGAAAGVAALGTPYMKRLPDDGGASERISESFRGSGRATPADLRGVARGAGKRVDDDGHVSRLAQSMKAEGFRESEPIVLRRYKDGKMVIRGGHHRLAAAERAGLKDVPIRIEDSKHKTPRTMVTLATSRAMDKHVKRARQPVPVASDAEISQSASRQVGRVGRAINNTVSRVDAAFREGRPLIKLARRA